MNLGFAALIEQETEQVHPEYPYDV